MIAASQQVAPDVFLLQAVKNLLELQDGAQAPPLRLRLGHLLPLHDLLLGSQQLHRANGSKPDSSSASSIKGLVCNIGLELQFTAHNKSEHWQ